MSWEDAIHWFDEAVTSLHDNDESGEYDSTMHDPPYQLMAWQAEMYAEGGHGLERLPERAGRLPLSVYNTGPSCSKLTTSLVNDSLKFTLSDTQIC